jgi:hypothetical protein
MTVGQLGDSLRGVIRENGPFGGLFHALVRAIL